jgi:predicted DNA binding CopG/RHH family protein
MALSRKAARSERATKEAAPRPPANIKRITLDLPEELHRAIKLNAIKEGVTMAQKLRALLMEHYAPTEPKNEA